MKKKLWIVAFACLMTLVMSGCALMDMLSPKFDAAGYVKAGLDFELKGESREEYKKFTASTDSELDEVYNDMQTELQDSFLSAFNVSNIPQETKDKVLKVMTDFMKVSKYEVGEAVKNDDGSYTVPITVYPLKFMEGIEEFANEASEEYLNGLSSQSDYDQDKFMLFYLDKYCDFLAEKVADPQYADAKEVTIKVAKDSSDGKYHMDESDVEEMGTALFDVEM